MKRKFSGWDREIPLTTLATTTTKTPTRRETVVMAMLHI
jgi:hypothetical protein